MIINEFNKLEQGETSTKLLKDSIYPNSKEIKDNKHILLLKEYGIFNKEKTHRYYLKINICGNKKVKNNLIVIMLNPSQHGSNKKDIFVDKTITNVIKIANDNNYNEITILNLFSTIQSDSNKVDFKFIDEENLEFIENYLTDKNDKILVAWGYKFKNNSRKIKDFIEFLKKKNSQIVTFGDKLLYPKHPGRMDINYIRNQLGKNNKAELKTYNILFEAK